MKYVLMFTSHTDLDEAVPADRRQEVYQSIFGWFEKHGAAITDSGAELQGRDTATTVKSGADGSAPVVVDGPFIEGKESIGGFSVIDVPDLDAAIAMAKDWPSLSLPGVAVEIRPIVDHAGM
ncbi:YciI family protein [Microlunatus sp. GCM10028923]|uniref:YciI family protein n=1 Tax=Microlunatus sp. GCM10028923 TaxID=3273400 RepID=UPI003615155B